MKILESDSKITIHINKNLPNLKDKESLEKYIKKLISLIKKKGIEIVSGLYIARIYQNYKYGLIIELEILEELELFKDIIDLKILVYENSKMYLEIDDYFLVSFNKKLRYNDKFYLNIDDLSDYDLISLLEFGNIIYGENINNIELYGK